MMLLWFWGSKQKKAWFKLDDKLENVVCPEHEDTAGELVPLIMKNTGAKVWCYSCCIKLLELYSL